MRLLDGPRAVQVGGGTEVQHQLHVGADCFSDGVEVIVALLAEPVAPAELHGLEAAGLVLLGLGHEDLGGLVAHLAGALHYGPVERGGAGVSHDPVLDGAAAHLVDGQPGGLAGYVPERHVYGAHGVDRYAALAAAAPQAAGEHEAPGHVGVGVGADEQASEPVVVVLDDRGDHGDGRCRGADAGYALVGIDPDEGRRPTGKALGDD